jgi:hypothetical protein
MGSRKLSEAYPQPLWLKPNFCCTTYELEQVAAGDAMSNMGERSNIARYSSEFIGTQRA